MYIYFSIKVSIILPKCFLGGSNKEGLDQSLPYCFPNRKQSHYFYYYL